MCGPGVLRHWSARGVVCDFGALVGAGLACYFRNNASIVAPLCVAVSRGFSCLGRFFLVSLLARGFLRRTVVVAVDYRQCLAREKACRYIRALAFTGLGAAPTTTT